ncbi:MULTISPECIES: lipoyl(octanoyl) transferase LipB [Salinivibrio]|uniref:Octanoyltransferase n=1 Tax=Salinivibrio kushneri TaxID=1908198 RepID=A0AB36K805_9GAMM|nr:MULTISPECIES: lipoyl(octanoyl) transferase LipB [Salinivibrio]ODP99185.1 octanoyltransferase [Salinivibrio sp. BNH]OOE32323.1 octanoyltransferase [Salinivibrio kushneri]OOE40968.1 octanoyltransferase [Salinivibrio kushneri]OOE45759.1 octanoyltransferase [Salinivibrio kushneri]OOE47679.1 octanoyltransferase [Salinivibrio kushneri]
MGLQHQLVVRHLGRQPYLRVWEQMRDFTDRRDEDTRDEVWLVEHDPVFTQGQAGKTEHVLVPGDIPVVQSDRGGQVTYHGPGQLVAYFLINLKRKKVGVRALVSHIEDLVVSTLAHFHVDAYARPDAPGVYVNDAKICSLGLRIRRGCSFHGLALNINMDLSPFQRINPCGYAGMAMTQLSDQVGKVTLEDVQPVLVDTLTQQLMYSEVEFTTESSDL